MKLELSAIRIDGGTQARAGIDRDTVGEYRAAIEDGDTFPPLTVFHDGTTYWLADGFHRWHAYKSLEAVEVEADVKQGERRDAVLYSVGANATHGLRRTNEDKRRAVTVLLEDEEWGQWSNREVSRKAGVSLNLVNTMRNELTELKVQSPVRKGADGRTINTANIGRSQPTTYSPPLTPDEPEEDDRPDYDPYADNDGLELVQAEAEIVSNDEPEDDEPYIPPYVSNPNPPSYPIKPLSSEPRRKEPPFVVVYTTLGKARSLGHRTVIDALNSLENQTAEEALENQIDDLIEMLRASKKQAQTERKTVEVVG